MKVKRWVITGGPGTGKSTLINELKLIGFHVMEEISRDIIRSALDQGTDQVPWKDLWGFSERVWDGRKAQLKTSGKGPYYYDRGLPDTIAYLNLRDPGLVPQHWWEYARENRYDSPIFITPPWEEIYDKDQERQEAFEEVLRIHDELVRTYERLNYELVEVPKGSLMERTSFIRERTKAQ